MRDPDVRWQGEPTEVDVARRALSARDDRSHKRWTDYLAAFAQAGHFTLVLPMNAPGKPSV